MSENIMKFKVLNKIKEDFLNEIKFLYVFKDSSRESNVFIVKKDDKVFAFGNNNNGVLGFGNSYEFNEFAINEELSNKQIIEFKSSFKHVIARTIDGKVYCWGSNRSGFIGNGKKDDSVYSKPELNQYLSDKNIIDICCGHNFSVVLTSNGEVYAWGENRNGQIGNGSKELYQLIPSKVKGFNDEKVVMISCGSLHSMALTESGRVFSWGNNSSGQLGHSYNGFGYGNVSEPSLLNLNNEILIKKISCGSQHSILLSSDGDIYTFGDNSKYQLGERDNNHSIPLKLEYKNKFIDIAAQYHISVALSVNNVFHVWGKVGDHLISTRPKKTEFQTFNDIFNHYYEITHKTLDFDIEYNFYNNKNKIKYEKQLNEKEIM